jgi:1,4-dihydroxy-6-naphthoate synthase
MPREQELMADNPREIVIYHSPDSDDAFMFYGLVSGAVSYPGYIFRHDLSDIETLNQRALRGELEVTAVSVHAFAHLRGRYLIMNSGASMGGKDYGPTLVSLKARKLGEGNPLRIAIPGEYTSAALALRIFLREKKIDAELKNIHFDKVQEAVKNGEVDAGVIIHEGQLTHGREGLVTLIDLGQWWWSETGLPLPLGVNIVRKDLESRTIIACATVLRDTIKYSLAHRKEALAYALQYGRGINESEADTFVGMYVNDLTVELGDTGRAAIELFLEKGRKYGFIPPEAKPEFVVER